MKLGIVLVAWGIIIAFLVAFRLGVQYVLDYGTGEFVFSSGLYIGLWFMIGGLPFIIGVRRITKKINGVLQRV